MDNIIVGNLLCEPYHLFSFTETEWQCDTVHETLFTNERYLPKILEQAIGVKSKEIRRNRPDLDRVLNKVDFFDITYGKNKNKRHVWIAVGE